MQDVQLYMYCTLYIKIKFYTFSDFLKESKSEWKKKWILLFEKCVKMYNILRICIQHLQNIHVESILVLGNAAFNACFKLLTGVLKCSEIYL